MKNLKQLRKSRNLTQKELADLLLVNQTAVSQWEREVTSPGHNTLVRLAEVLNVSLDHLMGRPESSSATINVYGTVPAGIAMEAIEDIIDTEEISATWLHSGREYFGLKVKGDSMFPKYMEGDTVIVRRQSVCESGEECVVYVNEYETTLKKVIFLADGSIQLQPLNPNYAPVTYPRHMSGEEPVKIAGVVVEIRRKVG